MDLLRFQFIQIQSDIPGIVIQLEKAYISTADAGKTDEHGLVRVRMQQRAAFGGEINVYQVLSLSLIHI